jgi:predicted nucleic acid-binding protein
MSAGLVDTSVVIDWGDPDVAAALPDEVSVSVITFAELAAGTHLASTTAERARRQARVQQMEATFDPLVFDVAAARSYGQVVAAVSRRGRSHRRRIADLLIAATAHSNDIALYTRNPDHFEGLSGLVSVVAI